MIYLDYAATTPMRKKALEVYYKTAEKYFGNASSLHDIGTIADTLLEKCREQFARSINGSKDGIYFTSGGTESNILGVASLVTGNNHKGKHLITTEVEHASLFHLFKQLETNGYEVTYLGVDENGEIRLHELEKAIREDTVLASIHHGNAEIGTIQNIMEIGKLLHEKGVIFHTDVVQTYGHIEIDVEKSYIDSLSVSSHKIYGPKGTGFCYINPRLYFQKQLPGTTHENGFRPGTVDVPAIAAFTTAAQYALAEKTTLNQHIKACRDYLEDQLGRFPEILIEGSNDTDKQLSHIIGLTFPNIQGQYIMLECNRDQIAVSTGSACQAGMQDPSRSMLSIGRTKEEAMQFIRLSLGKGTEVSHIDQFMKVVERLLTV